MRKTILGSISTGSILAVSSSSTRFSPFLHKLLPSKVAEFSQLVGVLPRIVLQIKKGDKIMPRKKVIISSSDSSSQPMRPALTPEARENQMIALAMDLVEQRLKNGTASSAETVHFLKLASSKEKLEQEILEEQKKLLEAKTDNLKSAAKIESLYAEALEAFRSYSGSGGNNNDEPEDY